MSSDASSHSARRSLRIGHYEVMSHIATGGMGAVYKAVDVQLGREVAIKVLSADLAAKPDMLDRFRHEAQLAAKLRHENVVSIYEFGEANGMLFLAMEFVDGIDLQDYITRKGKLDPEEARFYIIQAARALEQLHKQGLVHRDIKPSNFLITRTSGKPIVKLTDLGLAREVDDAQFKLTRSGTTVGTVDYMSPEQARDSRSADIRSDIYSLGCTYYHMVAGQPPFPGGGLTERLYKHVEVEPPDVRQFNPKVPEATAAVIRHMLEKSPANRYQTPEELLKDLLQRQGSPNIGQRDLLASLAAMQDPAGSGRTQTAIMAQRSQSGMPKRYRDKEMVAVGPAKNWKPWAAAIGSVLAVALITIIAALWFNNPIPDVIETASGSTADPNPGEAAPGRAPAGEAVPPAEPEKSGKPPESDPPQPPPRPVQQPDPEPFGKPPARPPERKAPPPSPSPSQPPNQGTPRPPEQAKPPESPPPVLSEPTPAATPVPREPAKIDPLPRKPESAAPKKTAVATLPRITLPPFRKPDSEPVKRIEAIPSPRFPRLLESVLTWDSAKLRQDFEAPWQEAGLVAADGPSLRVSRLGRSREQKEYTSLANALAAIPVNQKDVILEIHDNGPLYAAPLVLTDRNLTIRAGRGYQPLLVCETQHASFAKAPAFLSVTRGNLTLESLEVVLKSPVLTRSEPFALVRVSGGDITARDCTVSASSKPGNAVSAFRLEDQGSAKPATVGATSGEIPKCRLSRCYVRGVDLTALDIRAAGAEVLLEDCLVAGGGRPLLEVIGRNGVPPITLRVAHSTLVGGQTLLRIRPATIHDNRPVCRWLSWDSLLARSHAQPGGEMVVLADGVGSNNMQWRAFNCLYAGWQTLLAGGAGNVAASQFPLWRSLWQSSDGDKAITESWPTVLHSDPSGVPAAAYRTLDTPACFADSTGVEPLGCSLSALPASRDGWAGWTCERFLIPPSDLPVLGQAPDAPAAPGSPYAGERIELADKFDLGQHLQNIQKAKALAPTVVMHLVGTGERRTSPIQVQGARLVLRFEPPPEGARPLTLIMNGSTAAGREALIDVEDGSLEIHGGTVLLPNYRQAPLPSHVIRVRGGELRLVGCRLEGPLSRAPDGFRGLIQFVGSGESALDRAHECTIVQSILVTGKDCLECVGTGARARLRNCVLVAGDAVHFSPGDSPKQRLNSQIILEHSSVAARRAVLRVDDAPALGMTTEPYIFQSKSCVFLNPFQGPGQPSCLLAYGDDALARGLVVWQGDSNVFDKRIPSCFAAAAGEKPEPQVFPGAWTQLWGLGAELKPMSVDLGISSLDLDRPQLALLVLPSALRAKFKEAPPGADLVQLGILKRSGRAPR